MYICLCSSFYCNGCISLQGVDALVPKLRERFNELHAGKWQSPFEWQCCGWVAGGNSCAFSSDQRKTRLRFSRFGVLTGCEIVRYRCWIKWKFDTCCLCMHIYLELSGKDLTTSPRHIGKYGTGLKLLIGSWSTTESFSFNFDVVDFSSWSRSNRGSRTDVTQSCMSSLANQV